MEHPEKPPTKNDDDTALIRAINEGDIARFDELVQRYENQLYGFGRRMCRNPQDAEDMVQNTFLNVFRYLKDFRFESRFKNWLYKIATSTCLKIRRKSRFSSDEPLSLEEMIEAASSEMPTESPAWARLPIDRILNDELRNRLQTAIHNLPENLRVVLVLRDIEGFSTQEAAQILALSEANIKVRLHRARLQLRKDMQDYFYHGK
ncbi:RNA polymerase sigma factor [Desulfatirhabdium butyrativorans]|uniref:RNA polymerase sigma factor n=1 Tax=Desulfatirhabdium butyrativorans TaxID=340467 RepID=UPI00041C277C|nr:sigma-70 family RNA polymerase sigma factor [Desulfatirhabdium butyrativorans]